MDSKESIDVFISYTHRDNKPLIKEQQEGEGWITRFHHYLEGRLGECLGRDPVIWRDIKLQGNDKFDEEIRAKLRKAKIIVTVISPSYLNSEWCMKELREFLKAAESSSKLDIENKSRIFKIIKTHVPLEEQPDEIRNLLGYEFFQLAEKGHPHEFIPEQGSPDYYKFRQKLNDLVWEMCELLEAIDKKIEAGEELPMSPPGKTVYLAETTHDLIEERKKIQHDLKQKGYTILPDRPLPFFLKDGNFRDSVRKDLVRCKLSIHLIGNMFGAVPEGEERSIIDLQTQLAMEQCKNNQLKQLIWIPLDLDKSKIDDRQEKYINDLQKNAPQNEVDFLKTTLEDFKTVIEDTLEKINNPQKELPYETPILFLVYDKMDYKSVEIVDDCFHRKGVEVVDSLIEGSQAQCWKIHRKYLSLCDTMMVYYNHGTEYWLKNQMGFILKASGYRKNKPPLKTSIFITGEKTDHKERFHSHKAEVIKDYNPSFCDVLDRVIDQIRK